MRALYVGSLWPERNASAGGVRTWSLVDTCLKAGITSQYGYIIYFFPPVLISRYEFLYDFRLEGHIHYGGSGEYSYR